MGRGTPGSAERQNNLKALHDRAVQFEQTTASRGLFRFLTFVSRLRDRGGDLGGGSGTEQRDNAVRIMTIHKSKGLEFPVVFLAGMSKTFNQQDLNAPFLMHKELGFGPKFVDEEKRVSFPTLPNLAIRRRSQLELLAEEMRVLYVGLTRPKEKLYLIGTIKDVGKKASSWAQCLSSANIRFRIICSPGGAATSTGWVRRSSGIREPASFGSWRKRTPLPRRSSLPIPPGGAYRCFLRTSFRWRRSAAGKRRRHPLPTGNSGCKP